MPIVSTAQDLFNAGNAAFVEDDFNTAIQKYSEAIELENNGEFFLKRSVAHFKLGKYQEALKDAGEACGLMKDSYKSFFRKGLALFHLDKVDEAKEAFLQSLSLAGDNTDVTKWIVRCDEKLEAHLPSGSSSETGDHKGPTVAGLDSSSGVYPLDLHMPSAAKARYDWYQTDSHVIITLLVKNSKKEDVDIHFAPCSISATVKLQTGSDYSLELDLAHPIATEQCVTRIMATKIEIKLKKQDGIRWSSLESDNESQFSSLKAPTQSTQGESSCRNEAKKYPSSAQRAHDWDKIAAEIAKEEENEKEDGDAALNKLFQKIYADGSDEVRKAMNKSFVESGGTVLSTNWKEVGKGQVECKPPDGMEYKKYEY